jgi:hypothetical protein
MSTREATIRNLFNLDLDNLQTAGGGFGVGGGFRRVVGIASVGRLAIANAAVTTVYAVPVATHKWAAKVGKYNGDPIWGEVFANIRESRKQMVEE